MLTMVCAKALSKGNRACSCALGQCIKWHERQ